MIISDYLAAGFPVLFVQTTDETQTVKTIHAEAVANGRAVLHYSASGHHVDADGSATRATFGQSFALAAQTENAVLIVRDFQSVAANAPMSRALLDVVEPLKQRGTTVVLLAPTWQLPRELATVGPVLIAPLATRDQLAAPLESVADSAGLTIDQTQRAALLDAAAGLTIDQAENAFALSVAQCGRLSAEIVQREKMRTIAALGFLTVEQPTPISEIGGLGALKRFLIEEVAPNQRDSALAVRGVLLAGLPGTGKSLSAKCAAAALGVPLVRLDVAACKAGLVGQSEANIRTATATIEALAPVVCWVDEIEKALPSGGANDSGVSAGLLGHLLTWLNDHRAPIFTIATCNNMGALPPEITRAGRFDERFYVDLPTESERAAVAAVHLAKLATPALAANRPQLAALAEELANQTPDYTGAELAAVVKMAARKTGREITLAALADAVAAVRPLARINAEAVAEFRQRSRATMRIANDSTTPADRVAVPPVAGRIRRISAN